MTHPSPPVDGLLKLVEWAREKSSTHHRLAHENPHLRTEHIASSAAYRNLADEIAAMNTRAAPSVVVERQQ